MVNMKYAIQLARLRCQDEHAITDAAAVMLLQLAAPGTPARETQDLVRTVRAQLQDEHAISDAGAAVLAELRQPRTFTPPEPRPIELAIQVAHLRQLLTSAEGQRDEARAVCRLAADALARGLRAGNYVALRPDDAITLAAELAKIGVQAHG